MPEEIKKSITIFKTPSWGILGTAFLIMLGCKCGGWCPDLSWWIVTAPLWGPWVLCIGFFVGFYFLVICGSLLLLAFSGIILGIEAIVSGIAMAYIFVANLFKKKGNK